MAVGDTTNFNNPTSTISLNNEEYLLTVQITRDVEDVGEKDKNSFTQILDNDKIKDYSFTSDLAYPITTGTLSFTDIGSYLFSQISADGRTYLLFNLEKTGAETNGVGISQTIQKFTHCFLITKIDMLQRLTEESTFKITFVSEAWYKFNNYLNFTSEGVKPVYEILQNLIKQAQLKLKPNKEIKQVDRKQFFITPTSFNLLDSIRYLLSIAIDPDNGFYFFIYNHIEDEYELVSLKQLYASLDLDELPARNVMIIPSQHYYPTGVISRQVIHELKELNVNGADTSTELFKPFSFTKYNYINREFTTNDINFNKLKGTLPNAQNKSFRNNINEPAKGIVEIGRLNYQREKDPVNNFTYYFSMARAFMWNNVIEFKIYGDIERKAGEVLFLTIPESDTYHEKLGGYWYILRVQHLFNKQTYYNYIQACRVDRKVVETNKELFIQNT